MHRLMVFLLLSACAAAPLVPQGGPFRPADAPIYSNAVLDVPRLAGEWQQVAGFGAVTECGPGQATISRAGSGLRVAYRPCQGGVMVADAGAMAPAGPGRFEVPGQPGPWWVLWADADYRTLVIGTPNGDFGFIMNRGAIPSDRLVAAKDILDWNGYDLAKLTVY